MAETPHLKQSNQLSHSQRDDCRVKQGAKYCITEHGPKSHKKHKQWDRHTKQWINNNRTTTLERIAAETTRRALIRILPSDPTPLIYMFVSSMIVQLTLWPPPEPCIDCLKRLSLQLWTFFEIFYFLFKSFVNVELSYFFTINLFTIAENCTEKWIIS